MHGNAGRPVFHVRQYGAHGVSVSVKVVGVLVNVVVVVVDLGDVDGVGEAAAPEQEAGNGIHSEVQGLEERGALKLKGFSIVKRILLQKEEMAL